MAVSEGEWALVAYGLDHRIYSAEYPDGDFSEVYDASTWTGKWYPALAGGPVGLLAGAGNQFLRSDDVGKNWYAIQAVNGIIKSIVVSDQSNTPTFLIAIERPTGETDDLYRTTDMGDSLTPDVSRVGLISAAQAVTPTGTGEIQSTFAVVGRRTPEGNSSYTLLRGG